MQITVEQLETAIGLTKECDRKLSLARQSNSELITNALRDVASPVGFRMSPYWKGRTDLPEEKALVEAVVEESYGIDYSEEGYPAVRTGFITALRWDADSEKVIVEGLEALADADGKMRPFAVPLEVVLDNEKVVEFIIAFGSFS